MCACTSWETTELCSRVFGHPSFRPGQREAIEALLEGRDVMVLMPTGGGKSLCYQVPALMVRAQGGGPTLVISPLIALMNDQVEQLRARGVAASALHSAQDELVQREVIAHLLTGKLDILYVSPERTVLAGFRRLLARAEVALLAVDEAHCISQWGHDFRREYLRLGELRELLGVPTMALTATATERVMDEMSVSLGLGEPLRVCGSFARGNLRFSVHHIGQDAGRYDALAEALDGAGLRHPGTGRAIIYCATRKKVEAVCSALKQRGFAAGLYHAGRSDRARDGAQRAFELGRARILVATNAFGMGVDHPDVRLIVHFQTPGSVEAYYQEAGRAGRDGDRAECLLFFGVGDLVTQRYLNRHSAGGGQSQARRERLLASIEAYARATICRQQFFARYFTGKDDLEPCGVCDICRNASAVATRVATATRPVAKRRPCQPLDEHELEVIVHAVSHLRRPVGKALLARALRGSRAKALRRPGLLDLDEHGELASHDERCIQEGIEALLAASRLERRGMKYPTVWLKGRPVRERKPTERRATERHQPAAANALQRALQSYRSRTARILKWKRYMVFNNAALRAIAELQPDSLWTLQQIHGLGPAKIERFGDDILDLVRRYGERD